MKAMILSAGYGMRLRPLTEEYPKPLLKIGKETLLSNSLKFLEKCGIKHVVINVHYLAEKIIDFVSKNKFNLEITLVEEKNKILDTGGGVLNAIKHFSEEFLIINPDTIWNEKYVKEFNLMKKLFSQNKDNKCIMLVVKREKSFDKNFKGDFNLEKDIISRDSNKNLEYLYTGLQLVKPEIFLDVKKEIFSVNEIWSKLIKNNQLLGVESNIDFLHVSTLEIYKKLNIK